MELHQIIAESIADTKASLWPAFAPEIILSVTILVMLCMRLFRITSWLHAFWVTLAGALLALFYAYPGENLAVGTGLARHELFTGMLVYDAFSVYVRSLLMLFVALFAIFTRLSGIPDRQDSTDFYCMVLGATIGMCLMASANHLLVVFLAVEMASVPSYALAAMLKGRKTSSEAALKYAVFGAGAAGVMLYGISLLAGLLNTLHFPSMAVELSNSLGTMGGPEKMVLALGGLMLGVGIAFKLSAVPFHFWCPDVFEGASAEVNAFLSVASKAGALALLVRVCLGLGLISAPAGPPTVTLAAAQGEVTVVGDAAFPLAVAGKVSAKSIESDVVMSLEPMRFVSTSSADDVAAQSNLEPVRTFIVFLVGLLSAVTMTFGNLAAYGQTNIKRLLAYSTIAHAGYMMLPLASAMAVGQSHPEIAAKAIAALTLYMGVYLFMNLGAFALVAFLRNGFRTETISDYAGLIHRSPGAVICFTVILFSLVGLPPFAGFVGKFAIFASLAESYQATGKAFLGLLLVLGGLNTVLSLFYYLRVAKVMVIDPAPERPIQSQWSMVSLSGGYIALVTLPLVLLFFRWNALNEWALTAARNLF